MYKEAASHASDAGKGVVHRRTWKVLGSNWNGGEIVWVRNVCGTLMCCFIGTSTFVGCPNSHANDLQTPAQTVRGRSRTTWGGGGGVAGRGSGTPSPPQERAFAQTLASKAPDDCLSHMHRILFAVPPPERTQNARLFVGIS